MLKTPLSALVVVWGRSPREVGPLPNPNRPLLVGLGPARGDLFSKGRAGREQQAYGRFFEFFGAEKLNRFKNFKKGSLSSSFYVKKIKNG